MNLAMDFTTDTRRSRASRPLARARERGVALLIVFVLFVILTLLVTQLQYTTKLEEELAEVRATDTLGTYAIASAAAHVMTLLAEDFREGRLDSGATGGGASMAMGAPGAGPGEQPGVPGDGNPQQPTGGRREGGGAATTGGAPGGDPGTHDYLLKRIFSPDTKSINGVQVKYVIRDTERTFNLNRLWEYPRVIVEAMTDQQEEDANREDQADANEDGEAEDVDPDGMAAANDLLDQVGEIAEGGLNSAQKPWVPPTEEQRELVREMLTRAIDLTIRMNEDRGFFYRFQLPNPASLAVVIEDFCYQRRAQPFQNSFHLVSELLNIEGLTPELFYGPIPDIPPNEEFYDTDQFYAYRKDEFGDLVGEALYASEEWRLDQEYRRAEFEQLMSVAEGPFQHYAGLGALGNPLTRSMQEYPEDVDGLGLLVPPQPIGLRDIFSTHSSGKININTASPPVIYGLLLSLEEEEAQKVALDVESYRYLYQEEMSPEELEGGVAGVDDARSPDLGQPRRQPPEEDELLEEDGFTEEMSEMTAGLENPETNYFTDLRQLVLIDGEEGDADDFLTENTGVEVIDADFKTPYQRVRDDLSQVVVFGSSYFAVTLKIKADGSPVVREGTLLVHRDVEARRIEVIQWKELER